MSLPSEQKVIVSRRRSNTRDLVNEHASKELIFAVVGPVGSGTTEVAAILAQLAGTSLDTPHVTNLKASQVISRSVNPDALAGLGPLQRANLLQNAGDELRKGDEPAVGALLVAEIKARRALFDAQDQAPQVPEVSVLHPKKTRSDLLSCCQFR